MTMTNQAERPAEQSRVHHHSDTMRAVTQNRYGDSSVLSVATVERPTIGPHEVLVKVEAAGLDRGTEHLMTGRPWLIRLAGYGLRRPKDPILGLDVAGTVLAIGSDVQRFDVGDEVFGLARGRSSGKTVIQLDGQEGRR